MPCDSIHYCARFESRERAAYRHSQGLHSLEHRRRRRHCVDSTWNDLSLKFEHPRLALRCRYDRARFFLALNEAQNRARVPSST